MMITMAGLLVEQPFFAGMRPVHLERLSYYARRSTFRAGARIFNEGGHANGFWLIREGTVQLDITLPDRGQVAVETLQPGAVLGWSWLFPPYTWHFGALAVEPVLAIEFDGPAVQRLCEGSPELGYELTRRFLNVVFERMQATRMRMIKVYGPA
jgi:CRP/FNR family cyclic AMP-dependent transcriptional regulator